MLRSSGSARLDPHQPDEAIDRNGQEEEEDVFRTARALKCLSATDAVDPVGYAPLLATCVGLSGRRQRLLVELLQAAMVASKPVKWMEVGVELRTAKMTCVPDCREAADG